MKNVIIRNIERLLDGSTDNDREPIEPMTEWKWNRLYQLSCKYGITAWLTDGIKAYEGDFFMQMPDGLRQLFLNTKEEKNPENLKRFLLYVERSLGPLHHLTAKSLHAYASDFINTIKNIEE